MSSNRPTGVRILKERADEAGRPVVIADADRTNATLGAFYEGVERPDHPDEKTVADWLDEESIRMSGVSGDGRHRRLDAGL